MRTTQAGGYELRTPTALAEDAANALDTYEGNPSYAVIPVARAVVYALLSIASAIREVATAIRNHR